MNRHGKIGRRHVASDEYYVSEANGIPSNVFSVNKCEEVYSTGLKVGQQPGEHIEAFGEQLVTD